MKPLLLGLALAAAAAQGAPALEVVGDGIPRPLTDSAGDATRGRTIVVTRQSGLCLLCHGGPFPEERAQGDLAPSLAGVGARYSPAQLRLRLVDPRRLNPESVMPSYHRDSGFERVAPAWRDRPVLTPQQIEDVVAFLATLK